MMHSLDSITKEADDWYDQHGKFPSKIRVTPDVSSQITKNLNWDDLKNHRHIILNSIDDLSFNNVRISRVNCKREFMRDSCFVPVVVDADLETDFRTEA